MKLSTRSLLHNLSLSYRGWKLRLQFVGLSFLLGMACCVGGAVSPIEAQELDDDVGRTGEIGPTESRSADSSNQHNYLFLQDTSYSMGLRLPGQPKAQWQYAAEELSLFLDSVERVSKERSSPPPEYSLSRFSDTGTFEVAVPFTISREQIESAYRDTDFWYATDFQDALGQAIQYIEDTGKKNVTIVFISDGVETRRALFSLPQLSTSGNPKISVNFIQAPLKFNPVVERRISSWRQNAGPISENVKKKIVYEASSSILLPIPTQQLVLPLFFYKGGFLIGLLIAVFLLPIAIFFVRYSRPEPSMASVSTGGAELIKGPERQGPVSLHYKLHYNEYHHPGKRHARFIELHGSETEIPVTITPAGFDYPNAVGSEALITFEKDGCFINSDEPLLVNGVAVRRRKLKSGIIINFSSTHYEFVGIERQQAVERSKVKMKPPRQRRVYVPSAAAFLRRVVPLWTAGIVFWLVVLMSALWTDVPVSKAKVRRHTVSAKLRFEPYHGKNSFVLPFSDTIADSDTDKSIRTVKVIGATWNPSSSGQGGAAQGSWSFPGLEDVGKIDSLYFHAHPDDEALDFGGSLAKAEQEGKRTAVVLFTDGESGLSRGPGKRHGNSPEVLESIRIREAQESLQILGVDVYIRLGFRNHPYSSQAQVLPIEEVYNAWGGYQRVESAVYRIIEAVDPRVVVGPDGPSNAREHFEHEAVGLVVRRAVEKIHNEMPVSRLQKYLCMIDPMQQGLYRNVTGIDVLEPVRPFRVSPRSVQNRALKAHASQIDARIVGLEYTPLFDSEYYQVTTYNE